MLWMATKMLLLNGKTIRQKRPSTKWLKKRLVKSKASKSSKHLKTEKSGPAELQKDNLPKDAKKHFKQSFMKEKPAYTNQRMFHPNDTTQATLPRSIPHPCLIDPAYKNEEPFYRNEFMKDPVWS